MGSKLGLFEPFFVGWYKYITSSQSVNKHIQENIMPSLIGSGAFGTAIDANYRKDIVPFSRFGTRKIVWFRIGHLHTTEDFAETLNVVIDAIQTKGEIVTVGAPYIETNYGKFIVGLFEDTFNDGNNIELDESNPGNGHNSKSETLQQAIQNALDASGLSESNYDVAVLQIYMRGAPWGSLSDARDGWTDNSDFAEPDYKRDFDNGVFGA